MVWEWWALIDFGGLDASSKKQSGERQLSVLPAARQLPKDEDAVLKNSAGGWDLCVVGQDRLPAGGSCRVPLTK